MSNEKKSLAPQVCLDFIVKGIIDEGGLQYLRDKFCDNEILFFNPVYPEEFGFVHNYHYLNLKEEELTSYMKQVKEKNSDFSFALYNNEITSLNYYYRNGFSYIRIKNSLALYLNNEKDYINNIEWFINNYDVSRACLEHLRAFEIHKFRDDVIHLTEEDFDFSRYVFEGLSQGKYYKIIGNDIKFGNILNTFSLGIDKEYLAGHDHYDYDSGIVLGSSYLMYHSEDYAKYLDFNKLKNYDKAYQTTILENGMVKTQLYQDINAFDDETSLKAMWDFKIDLDLEATAHKLLGIVYPTISLEELNVMKDDETKLVEIEVDEYHTSMYYYILFQSNNSFDYSRHYYQKFIREVMILRNSKTNFELVNNRSYYTKSLGTEFVEIAYYNYDKKVLDFGYNSLTYIDDIIEDIQAREKKNKTDDNLRRTLIEKMSCYLVLTLIINNKNIDFAREGNTKPLGYLEVSNYAYDIEAKLHEIIFNTKKGIFFKQDNKSIIEYYNEISSMARLISTKSN
ncbi:MAG: hypothetical protein LBR40_01420 [Bacilli bacterium]|jgi:hypothetical protein|nr:hypothetical protein [Bacilli bacterium]